MSKYQSTKTFGHEVGLSCCFRQWRAESHCNQLHGYALSFKFVFEADTLDEKNWVQDFGGLKQLKKDLESVFDHTLAVASDDPNIHDFYIMQSLGMATVVQMEAVGCEAFAELAYHMAQNVIDNQCSDFWSTVTNRVRVVSCEVSEHGANSAIYYG